MPTIAGVGTTVPHHRIEQSEAREIARHLYKDSLPDIDRLLPVFDHAGIDRRYFCVPPEWFADRHSFGERNRLYVENAIALSDTAIERAVEDSGVAIEEFDYLIFVSTTGLATPSIDAHLMNRLPFRSDLKRLPIWGLGCGGGAASLSRAMDIAQGAPDARILIVVVELCGLTFVNEDRSREAFVATALFGDSAAALVVTGSNVELSNARRPKLVASRSETHPDSLDVMGWRVSDDGLRVLMSRDIPILAEQMIRPALNQLLNEHGLDLSDIRHLVLHPGGKKVLDAYRDTLHLDDNQIDPAVEILRRYGNISSASVCFVLEEVMRRQSSGGTENVQHGIVAALGPGFTLETILLRTDAV